MKKRLYFDTSALLKEFVSEVSSDLIDKTLLAAESGKLQIITSRWSINEAVSVIDRKNRNKELGLLDLQVIYDIFAQRIVETSEEANFRIVPVANAIIEHSMLLTVDYHIRPPDALHLSTTHIFDCSYLLVRDKDFVRKVKPHPPPGLEIIDLENASDRKHLESELGL